MGLTLQRQRKEIKRNLVLHHWAVAKKQNKTKPRTTNNPCGVHLILANWARHSPLLPETIWKRLPGPCNIKVCGYPVHVQGPMSQAPQNPEGGQMRLLPQISYVSPLFIHTKNKMQNLPSRSNIQVDTHGVSRISTKFQTDLGSLDLSYRKNLMEQTFGC